MHDPARPWRTSAGCVIVRVRVSPKSSKDTMDGVEPTAGGPALKVRVRAVSADGETNAAVERPLAATLEVPKSAVVVASGHQSRVKSIEIAGDVAHISARLAAISGSV